MNRQYLMLLILMSTPIEAMTSSCVTISTAFTLASHDRVKKMFEEQGGIYSQEAHDEIMSYLSHLLNRDRVFHNEKIVTPSTSTTGTPTEGPLSLVTHKTLSSLKTVLPSVPYAHLLKAALTMWSSVHRPLSQIKESLRIQELALASSLRLRVAHQIARDIAVALHFILYTPDAHPCDRMYALFLINTIQLIGKQGLIFSRSRDRTNRFYFSQTGTFTEFDPSKNNARDPKRILALDRLLKGVYESRGAYMQALKVGSSWGIKALDELFSKASTAQWETKAAHFWWQYVAGFFKEVTQIDVMHLRTVDPARIFAHQENRDFLTLMHLCSPEEVIATQGASLATAQSIINNYADSTIGKLMRRYYVATIPRTSQRAPYSS